jgi:hypothetical protein
MPEQTTATGIARDFVHVAHLFTAGGGIVAPIRSALG